MGVMRTLRLLAAICVAASAAAGGVMATEIGDFFSSTRRHQRQEPVLRQDAAEASISMSADEIPTSGGPERSLLHGCHKPRCLSVCPRCTVSTRSRFSRGHCKSNRRRFLCQVQKLSSSGTGQPLSIAESIVAAGFCPNLHASAQPEGLFDALPGGDLDDDVSSEYAVLDGPDVEVLGPDVFAYEDAAPEFWVVETPEGLQEALRAGAYHILVTAHLDMTGVTPERDRKELEALNAAVGRVKNTTLSIAGFCEEPPPESFGLTEPVPPGACAILVQEDFLDASLATSCLLLDSLYVAIMAPGSRQSAVLVLQVDGLMWITNCVFQGAGERCRAIDTNTVNGGRPELYIRDTTFTTFKRNVAPGIRVLSNSRLWLDNVTFRNITQTMDPPIIPRFIDIQEVPPAAAVVAYRNVLLVMVNVTIEGNEVLGEPAGVRAIAVNPNGTEVYADTQLEVWQWPGGPAALSHPDTNIATWNIQQQGRPQLEAIQAVQQEVAERGLQSGRASTSDA